MTNDLATVEARSLEGQVVSRPAQGALANTDAQRAVAEVQAAMMIARANPRDEKAAIDRILNACQRQRLAEAALYSYSRGGSEISGPSIRLAEALAQNWGNIQFGIREIEQRGGESTVQAFAWDVETNVKREMVFTVPHVRHTKRGSYKLDDPRDVYEMVANNGARRLRSCILAVIPGDVIDMAVEQVEHTMRAKADTSPDAIQKIVVAFQDYGVTQQQIETRIQRRLMAIQPAQVVSLKKIYTSLRDGMSAPADWFDPIEVEGEESAAGGNAAAKAALKKAARRNDADQQNTEEASGTVRKAPGAEKSSPAERAKGSASGAPDDGADHGTNDAAGGYSLADQIGLDDEPEAPGKHPAEDKANELLEQFSKAETILDLERLYGEAEQDIDAMPDEIREVVIGGYNRHRVRLGAKRVPVQQTEPAK